MPRTKSLSISIAIPALNEEKTIEIVSKEALREMKKITTDYELFLINDGSKDKTGEIANKLAKKDKHVKVRHHKKSKGFSGVQYHSLKGATKEFVMLAPADGQFMFKQLPAFIDAIKNYDIVFGYRVINEEPFRRKIQSRFFHFLSTYYMGIHLKEFTSVSMWRKEVLDKLRLRVDPKSNSAVPDMVNQAARLGYTFGEVPINWHSRLGGEAKGKIRVRLIYDTIKEFVKLNKNTKH